ncbi:hypothetical protein ACF0H5_024505 [Mactra antiquata]
MASSSSPKTSEETFEYICTACANDDLIKEALKYCVECQQYCCKDCLTSHRRISSLKGHSFLENSSVKPQGQPRTLPALPTIQCSKHVGKILDMYCENHDVVCCYVCAAEDHKSCKDIVQVLYNIDRLYSKTGASQATSKLNDTIDTMTQYGTNTYTLLKQLQVSKHTAIKAVSDFRIEMERILKKQEQETIKEIEEEYKMLESQILKERKRFQDYIDDLKNLKQASANIAQLFVGTKLAEMKCITIKDEIKGNGRIKQAEIKFIPSKEMKTTIEKMVHLGKASAIASRKYNLYTATKVCDVIVKLEKDQPFWGCSITGSCIVDDTFIFTDYFNHKLKRFDISTSLIDYCQVPGNPRGVCRVGEKEIVVACNKVVQFVSVHDSLSLLRSITMNHDCYGIAHSNGKLYITDGNQSLYMYDMSGSLLKTVTRVYHRQSPFEYSRQMTFNDKNDRLFVCDDKKGLVCFNAQCDYIETITDPDVRPVGVCVDGYGKVIVANSGLQTIVECDRDGQKCGTIVNLTRENPKSVCVHHGLRKMFVCYSKSDTVEVYDLIWGSD